MTKAELKKINKIAKMIYECNNGGTTVTDFKKCYDEYHDGRTGWIREHNAFVTAINIYNMLVEKNIYV